MIKNCKPRAQQHCTIDLAIDKNGICEIIFTLWLSKVKHEADISLVYLSDTIIDTSTGGIIAADVSVLNTKQLKRTEYKKMTK